MSTLSYLYGGLSANTITASTITAFGITASTIVTTERIQITSGATDGYVLTSDAVGNAIWQATQTPNNVIVGSGTTNYVTKWDSSSGLSSTSLIYDDGINVGIGTTTPTEKLEVSGNAFVQGDLTITGNTSLQGFTGTSGQINGVLRVNGNLVVTGNTGVNWFSGSSSSDFVRITQTGTGNAFVVEDSTNPDPSPFVIDASGNTAIGITTATYKLDVNGQTRHRGNLIQDPSTFIIMGTGSSISWTDANSSFPTSVNNKISWTLNNDSAQIYAFQPRADKLDFVFKVADNVGGLAGEEFVYWVDSVTGEQDDSYPLSMGQHFIVNPSRRYALSASTSGAGTSNFYILQSGATALTQSVVFANTSTRNVGIGTANPTEKLEVSGTTKTTNFQMTSGATNGYVLTSDASGNASWNPIPATSGSTGSTSSYDSGNTYVRAWTFERENGISATIGKGKGKILLTNGSREVTILYGGDFLGNNLDSPFYYGEATVIDSTTNTRRYLSLSNATGTTLCRIDGMYLGNDYTSYVGTLWTGATGEYDFYSMFIPQTSGDFGFAAGWSSFASDYSAAFGPYSRAIGNSSFAEGNTTTALGNNSHSEGFVTLATGSSSHAEGYLTKAFGTYSHSEGYLTTAIGSASHTEGTSTIATGSSSHAEGNSTKAWGISSHSEGGSTTAVGESSHAEGGGTTAIGIYSHAEGQFTITSGQSSHAEGIQTTAIGLYSHAEGQGTKALGSISHAEGNTTTASGQSSHSEGSLTTAIGASSHAEGGSTTASGQSSHTEGESTKAFGQSAHAEGIFSIALGSFSHAEGYQTYAFATRSHAEGDRTMAYGIYSHAEGTLTTASGTSSHAEGEQTYASGDTSHAEGRSTTSIGLYSHAGGYISVASGQTSFVHSYTSQANGDRSAVIGGQSIIGNANDTVYVPDFVIKKAAAIPSSSSDTTVGEPGSITWDNTYLYFRTSTQWLRISGLTF